MYERNTGDLLLEIERLEQKLDEACEHLEEVTSALLSTRARLEREQSECDDQARLVMVFTRRYEQERTLADQLAAALRQESRLATPLDLTHASLRLYDQIRNG